MLYQSCERIVTTLLQLVTTLSTLQAMTLKVYLFSRWYWNVTFILVEKIDALILLILLTVSLTFLLLGGGKSSVSSSLLSVIHTRLDIGFGRFPMENYTIQQN